MGLLARATNCRGPSRAGAWAIDRPGHPRLGDDDLGALAGLEPLGVKLSTLDGLTGQVDAMIDFSHPSATLELVRFCLDRGIPLIVGTTGFSPEQRNLLEQAAAKIPLLVSPNMSRAVNLLMRLVGETARLLGQSADIEIVERHHRLKKDAPSGRRSGWPKSPPRRPVSRAWCTAGKVRWVSVPATRSASTRCEPVMIPASTR